VPRFTQETAVHAVELQQLMADWCYALDIHGGEGITALCTDDCTYMLGGKPFVGHDAIDKFYAARNERVATQQKDGIRTQRHSISNFRVIFEGADGATVHFLLVNYSHEGRHPVPLVGPTIVADVKMGCRQVGGEWLISLFDSEPIFVGSDPFLNASVVKK
jgi:hypothetical protein